MAGVRCESCNNIVVTGYYYKWLKLYCFLDFLRLEGYIEASTFDEMADSLLGFKGFALDEDERLKKKEN